jgi:hypothetical protein
MCEYQRIKDDQLPMCEYTKTLCTLCVLGNGNTYKEAEKHFQKMKGGAE